MANRNIKDITGLLFNKLTVISLSHTKNKISYWNTKCDCGINKIVNGSELKRGGVKSCGCLLKKNIQKKVKNKTFKKEKIGRFLNCDFCNKCFFKNNCFIKKHNFCSTTCHHSYMKNRVSLVCLECNNIYEVTASFFRLRGSKYCSVKCKSLGMSNRFSGENSHKWNGGVSYKGKRIRKGIEWKNWRKSVFERDNYTCQDCGIRSGMGKRVELHPHHIKQYALFPELRFDINNGLTLCKDCHKKTDTYLKPIKRLPNNLIDMQNGLD